MTVPAIRALGFCAHYSTQGDWAFSYALRLAQRHSLQLNVFHFLTDPYSEDTAAELKYSKSELAKLAFERERELRMYYDERAGDYLDVGFRLCYDDSWRELHRCLMIREFQLLCLGVPDHKTVFCGKPIEEFANDFVCPVVLVGPCRPNQFSLNSSAALLVDKLDIPPGTWGRIEQVPDRATPPYGGDRPHGASRNLRSASP
jgi:hypothetical protein